MKTNATVTRKAFEEWFLTYMDGRTHSESIEDIEKIENHGNYRSRVSLPANGFFMYASERVRKGSKAFSVACDNILNNADRIKTAILRSLVKNDIKTEE